MSDKPRKLLPYESQLADALGLTKEEYLDFVAAQQLYSDIKEGTVLDARNVPLPVVAIALTVIGTILQVAAALLAKPKSEGQRQQTREDVFAPRSGFNSLQELASYGDPVNLIYTDIQSNPNGGVRVNTSLLWSAVKSFGSSQYMQLVLLLGGGPIGGVDPRRAAIGQTPVDALIAQTYWIYFRPNSRGIGLLSSNNLLPPSPPIADPFGRFINRIYGNEIGYSAAISPTTSNAFGCYSPLPINAFISIRNEKGYPELAPSNISISGTSVWGADNISASNRIFYGGERITVILPGTGGIDATNSPPGVVEAANQRRTLAAVLDSASLFKLGSARFKLISATGGATDEGNVSAVLECIGYGRAPSVPFWTAIPRTARQLLNTNPQYQLAKSVTDRLLQEDQRNPSAIGVAVQDAVQFSRGGPSPSVLSSPNFSGWVTSSDGQRVPTIANAQQLLADGRIFVRDVQPITTLAQFRAFQLTGIRYRFVRNLFPQERELVAQYVELEKAVREDGFVDTFFYTKALTKIELASYETTTPCHVVDFALKARVFKRISGRQEKYGSDQVKGYDISDNGIKMRSAMFLFKYKKPQARYFNYAPGIFVVRRANDLDNFVYLRFDTKWTATNGKPAEHWQFEFEPVIDTQAELLANAALQAAPGLSLFYYLENTGGSIAIQLQGGIELTSVGRVVPSRTYAPPRNAGPAQSTEWDLFSSNTDTQLQTSFDNGPEFAISAVTEQIGAPTGNFTGLYKNLSLVAFNMYSGRNVQDLRAISMFVTQGRHCRLLRTSGFMVRGRYFATVNEAASALNISTTQAAREAIGFGRDGFEYVPRERTGYANRAPDIFLDTVLDEDDGIGRYTSDLFSIDTEQLAKSKKFCEMNGLFMDGIIADASSWREFWASTAPFSLLELAKRDGRESLIPAVPYIESTGVIDPTPTISALFNQGNILEDSYKEEFIDYGSSAEDVIVNVIYRGIERDGSFPRNQSVEVRLQSTNEAEALRETIDMSAFVTRREQAILVAKFLCLTRRYSRRSIEFKTFPTDSFVSPGSFIFVEFAQNQWDGLFSGTVEADGTLNIPLSDAIINGRYEVLLYNPTEAGNETLLRSNVEVVNGKAEKLRTWPNHVFVLGKAARKRRVFRTTEVTMDEEGEVTVRAVEHPTDDRGFSIIANGLLPQSDALFVIT